jgi:hypothetical protein
VENSVKLNLSTTKILKKGYEKDIVGIPLFLQLKKREDGGLLDF